MASAQSHTRALFNLAQMHLNGLGTARRDCALGVKLLKTVAERGSWATILGTAHRLYLSGRYQHALMLYLRAAQEVRHYYIDIV
jgi:TPR repeat protein